METTVRTLTKAITWQILGLLVMTTLSYGYTGSLGSATSLAVLTSSLGFVSFFIHEKIWQRIRWGKQVSTAMNGMENAH